MKIGLIATDIWRSLHLDLARGHATATARAVCQRNQA
jgi:hypothetical protein